MKRARRGSWTLVGLALVALAGCGSQEEIARDCDPAYPEICIWPPLPDLDCGQLPHGGFRVRPSDQYSHNLDDDNDGRAC